MLYAEALDYLYTKLPMYQRIGAAAYKKDLTNTIALLDILGNPHHKFTSIHVGGTNGKGSVTNMLASVWMEAGYKVGWYTSPHLEDFRERIRVNGVLCDEQFVIDFVVNMQAHIERIQPSFFELTVAMAFSYFEFKQVEVAVVEVGLGGRLDSTNVIAPILSVITNISFDHMQMLGNTLPEIAFEKAGIIKQHTPVVIGEYLDETLPVFEKQAALKQASLFPAQENVDVHVAEMTSYQIEADVSYLGHLLYPNLVLGLSGDYQIRNLRTTMQAIEVLNAQGLELPEDAIYEGLKKVRENTGFSGRWQVLHEKPLVVADCAHNSGGLRVLFDQVNTIPYQNLHIVTGAVHDKDIAASLKQFPTAATYYFCRPDIPRGLDAKALQEQAVGVGLQGTTHDSVAAALREAFRNAQQNDLVLICGSIFVVAEAIPAWRSMQ